MAPKLTVKKTAIDQAKLALTKTPPKEKEVFDLREAIAELRQEIEGILAKGYSFDEVSNLLSQSGIEIKGTSLKQYLAAFRRKDTSKKPSRRRTGKTSQGPNLEPRNNANAEQVTTETEPKAVVDQLEDNARLKNRSGTVKNTRKTSRRSGEFVEMSEDL